MVAASPAGGEEGGNTDGLNPKRREQEEMAAARPRPALYSLGEGRSTPRILPPWSRDPAAACPNRAPATP